MGRVVVIPQNYEDLSYAQRKLIIPICIAAFDRYDEPIAPEWFLSGVAPARNQLVRIANYLMGDPWCVSELAEATVHRLWAKHGSAVGLYPARRVLKKAMWVGEELMAGDWRRLKHPNLYLALETMEDKIRDQTLADPTDTLNYSNGRLFSRRLRTVSRTQVPLKCAASTSWFVAATAGQKLPSRSARQSRSR